MSRPRLPELADEIRSTISFGLGRTNRADDAPVDHPLFEDPAWTRFPPRTARRCAKARTQLGTVGSGNHYVDVLVDFRGARLGRRPLRQPRPGSHHRVRLPALSQGRPWGERARESRCCSTWTRPLGHDYWTLMNLAGDVRVRRPRVGRAQGRRAARRHANWSWCTTITTSRGARSTVARSSIVVRKGATPAFPGQQGFVGGSMGDDAVIVRGASRHGESTAARSRPPSSPPCTAPAGSCPGRRPAAR
jgi:tRNA-splicing ligase RtcB (3'-phosphate/5'-hydroxy nucleic acid ligase)